MKLNKTFAIIISGTPFIAQCAYSKIITPIKVCLPGYTVPSWTIACNNFSEKMS